MKLWVQNARQVVRVVANGEKVLAGDLQKNCNLAILEEANGFGVSILVDDQGFIAAIDYDNVIENLLIGTHCDRIVNASGRVVLPGFVDAHSHPVWAGDRVHEFAMKLAGASYMEIYQSGGGIHFTVENTRRASENELLILLKHRLQRMLRNGTVLVEAKSGYGLDTDNEMKMLRVLERAKRELPMDISSTFCGAHAVPRGRTAQEALEDIVENQFPALIQLQKAGEINVDSVDVFCEEGVYSVEQSRIILESGRKAGFRLNFHADELTPLGGAEMGAALQAEAMSHLEEISRQGIEAMAQQGCVAVILPTTAYFLRLKPPPVREMLDSGVSVALGSDFNPNAYCLSMPMVMNLACVLCHMTLPEVVVAATINAAAALGKAKSHGSLEVGKVGDFLIVNAPRWEHVIYQFGEADHFIEAVVKRGKIVYSSNQF